MVDRIDGLNRYAKGVAHEDDYDHPHFFCHVCGEATCLPGYSLVPSATTGEGWAEAIQNATRQLRGVCPECQAEA